MCLIYKFINLLIKEQNLTPDTDTGCECTHYTEFQRRSHGSGIKKISPLTGPKP